MGVVAVGTTVHIIGVVDMETKSAGVDVAVAKEKHGAEDWLGDQVEDTIEDSLGVGVDKVATLRNAPSNGVKEPNPNGQDTAGHEGLVDIVAECVRVLAADACQHIDDVKEGGITEGEISPLVGSAGQSANKTGYDHDLVDEDSDENRGPREAGGQEEVKEQQRRSDNPVDVADVEYLAGTGGADVGVTRADKLGGNGRLTEVGSHREVCNGGNERDRGRDVVE